MSFKQTWESTRISVPPTDPTKPPSYVYKWKLQPTFTEATTFTPKVTNYMGRHGDMVDPLDTYILVQEFLNTSIGFPPPNTGVKQIMLSSTCFEALKTKSWDKFKVDPTAASPLWLIARLPDDGRIILAEVGDKGSRTNPLNRLKTVDWEDRYKKGINAPAEDAHQDGFRGIDPEMFEKWGNGPDPPSKLQITIVPIDKEFEQDLQDAVLKITAEEKSLHVGLGFEKDPQKCEAAGLIMYDVDPLNKYQTWVPWKMLADYLSVHEDRPLPNETQVQAILTDARNKKLDKNAPPEYSWIGKRKAQDATTLDERAKKARSTTPRPDNNLGVPEEKDSNILQEFSVVAQLSAKTIEDASKVGREGSQAKVTGWSANVVVKALGWSDYTNDLPRVDGKGPLNYRWGPPHMAKSAAEWLHKSAYKYGGLEEPNVKQNLCVGTSEMNSVMIRWEEQYKRLLRGASKFQGQVSVDDDQRASQGSLHINVVDHDWNYMTWEIDPTTKLPKESNRGYHFNRQPPDLAVQRTWLNYGLSYALVLRSVAPIYFVAKSFQTHFWPFQRRFYFQAQGVLDALVLKALIAKNMAVPRFSIRAFAMAPEARRNVYHVSEAQALWSKANSGALIMISGVQVDDVELVCDELVPNHEAAIDTPLIAPLATDRYTIPSLKRNLSNGITPTVPNSTLSAPRSIYAPAGSNEAIMTSTAPIPDSFVLAGNIKLFGLFPAKLYSLQGQASYFGVKEIVALADELSLSSLAPALKDSAADAIQLRNVQLEYTEGHPEHHQVAGTYLKADVTLGESMKPLADALRTVFKQSNPRLTMECLISYGRGWDKLEIPSEISLTCTIPELDIEFGDLIRFTSVAVGIHITKRFKSTPYSEYYGFNVDLSGLALLKTSAAGAPSIVHFAMQPLGDLFSLSLMLQNDDWKDVCGIQGLDLSEVFFSTAFSLDASPKLIDLKLSATMVTPGYDIAISGNYGGDGHWSLEGCVSDLELDTLVLTMSKLIDSGDLMFFDYDIEFSTLWLRIDSEGVMLNGKVNVAGHEALDAVLEVKRNGILIKGAVTGAVEYGGFKVENPSLAVSIPVKSSSAAARDLYVSLEGTISFENCSFTTAVYLTQHADNSIGFAFYGEYLGPLSLGGLVDAAKGSFLDIEMTRIALIGGNTPNLPSFANANNYGIKEGVQLYATIGNLPALDSATKQNINGLTLRAAYDLKKELTFAIDLPASTKISFGQGLETGPISVGLVLGISPSITITASLDLHVQNQEQPLVFTFGMRGQLTSGSAFCQMDNYWVNPLGISKNLKIGPHMALQLDLTYAPPAMTVGIHGGLAFGTKLLDVAVALGNDPKTELISADIQEIALSDLTSFATDITGIELTQIDPSLLTIHRAAFSMSSGVTIGTINYPAGVKFDGVATLFNKNASLLCHVVASQGIAMAGSIDAFEIGPLIVSGKESANPNFALSVGTKEQNYLVDGKAKFLEDEASIFLKAALIPSPTFDFDADIHFTDILIFQLHAKMLGQFALEKIGELDFELTASLEQHILNYISTQLKAQLEAASKGAKEGFEVARAGLETAKKLYEKGIADAQAALNSANEDWTKVQNEVNGALSSLEQQYNDHRGTLANEVTNAEAKFNQVVEEAKNNLGTARMTAAAKIKEAEDNLENKRRETDQDIRNHENDVERSKSDMDRQFGNAVQNLTNAENALSRAEADMKPTQDEIDNKNRELHNLRWTEGWKAPGLAAQIAALEAKIVAVYKVPYETAKTAVSLAKSIVDGPGYAAAKATVNTYEESLARTRQAAGISIKALEDTLGTVRDQQNNLVQSAESHLRDVSEGSDAKKLWDSTRKNMQDFEDSMVDQLRDARANVSNLTARVEKKAFDAATGALTLARDDVAAYNAAQRALDTAQALEQVGEHVAKYILDHSGAIIDVNEIHLVGQLQGLITGGRPLSAAVKGSIAGQDFAVNASFTPGDAGNFIHQIFEDLWKKMIDGVISIAA